MLPKGAGAKPRA